MAKQKYPLFDTNSIIEYRQTIENEKNLLGKMRLSMVVYYELTATTIDNSMLKFYDKWFKLFDNDNLLLTPAKTDWYETAKLIRRLRFGEKSASHGKTPKMPNAQKLQNDALIARTAWTNDCFVVTTDVDDFEHFLPFMKNLIIISAEDFFRQ
jgi:predicted nucleic acid-binding protein